MNRGQKVTLADGQVVNVVVEGGVKDVEAFHKGEKITVKKRTTTIKITEDVDGQNEPKVICEQTVSCSHLDDFTRASGRKEAWRKLIEKAGKQGPLANRSNRPLIVAALNITDEPPKLKDKEAIKKAKAQAKAAKEKKAKQKPQPQ